MEIREIHEKKEWEGFVIGEKPHTFLQSWNWGEFNKAMSHKIWRLGIYQVSSIKHQVSSLIGVALVIKIAARRGTFLFAPHGPIVLQSANSKGQIAALVGYLKNLARYENCGFIRISPIFLKAPENEKLFGELGFRVAPIHMHAETMWILDIMPGENELLKNMRKTTRYLIRKAESEGQSEGVEIIKSSKPEYLEIFQKLYQETARRQRFSAYGEGYIKRELESFRSDNQIQVFLAKYNNEFVSGALIIFYGDSAFYHHGASSDKYPKIAAPYLLQWEIIREVKRRGLRYYNFWGITEDQRKTDRDNLEPANSARKNLVKFFSGGILKMTGLRRGHPWTGLTLFKKGFGGFSEEYLPAQDLILKKSYWIAYLIEKMRKAKRGL